MRPNEQLDLIPMESLELAAPLIRSAAHPLRLRIIDYLDRVGEPKSVTDIADAAEAGQAFISQQLRIMKDQGILACRRQGTFVYYTVANPAILSLLTCIRSHCRLTAPKGD